MRTILSVGNKPLWGSKMWDWFAFSLTSSGVPFDNANFLNKIGIFLIVFTKKKRNRTHHVSVAQQVAIAMVLLSSGFTIAA